MAERAPEAVLHAVRLARLPRRIGSVAARQLPGVSASLPAAPVPETPQPPRVPPELIEEAQAAGAQRGYEDGYARGQQAAQREFEVRQKRFDQLLLALAQKRDDLLEVLEDDFVEVIAEAFGSILHVPELRRDLILEAVRRAARGHAETHVISVRISPQDRELLASSAEGGRLGLGSAIRVLDDAQVRLGGCIVETAQGSLDARLEVLLEKVRGALLDSRLAQVRKEDVLQPTPEEGVAS